MSSIIRVGEAYHGINVFGRGVFIGEFGFSYAGQIRDGYACGLGVLTYPDGYKEYAEHGRDGQCDGRCLGRYAHGDTGYSMYDRGAEQDIAVVYADGRCWYNGAVWAPYDPR